MDMVPRRADLDESLAREGASEEIVQVYGDWLLSRDHPLGVAIADARRAALGDRAARERLVERQFAMTDPERFPSTRFRWCAGAVVRVEESPQWSDSGSVTEPWGLYSEPELQLIASVRVAIAGLPEMGALWMLSSAPPSVGRIEVTDHLSADGAGLSLSHIEQPWLSDLRVRAPAIDSLPRGLERLERLELRADRLGCALPQMPRLGVLHLWSGIGRGQIEEIVALSPGLELLGLHHPGSLGEALEILSKVVLPRSLRELAIAVPVASERDLERLAERVPAGCVARLPFAGLPGSLRAPIVSAPARDQPIWLVGAH